MRRPHAASIGLGLLLVLAAGSWLWYGLTQRSIVEDDGISILAAQGILRHGIPQLPSGALYHRGYVPHYLLAGSMALFGTNDLGIMMPSLFLGLVTVFLVFRTGRDVLKRPFVGLIAAALLAALQLETFYATSPRMYMALQCFSLLASYCAWRGFVAGERAFRWPAAFAAGAAILSHQQGGVLLVALPAAVLAARRMQRTTRPRLPWRAALTGLAVLCGLFYLASIYKPPTALRPIVAPGRQVVRHRELNLDVQQWRRHGRELERIVPFGLLLSPVVLWAALSTVRRNHRSRQHLMFFMTLAAVNALAVVAATRSTYQRFWFYALPPYLLLLVMSAAVVRDEWNAPASRPPRPWDARGRLAAAGVGGLAALVWLAATGSLRVDRYVERVRSAFGSPCVEGECMASTEHAYRRLRDQLAADDLIIATNPWTASYYLGRVDGVLLQSRLTDGSFAPFETPTDRYFGAPLVDTAGELESLRAGARRVWVVTDRKLERYNSQDTRDRLTRSWTLSLWLDRVRVYCNRGERIAASLTQENTLQFVR